ncbi:hypothetical protein ACH42_14385 [Endozoicomonas sp. (ex Bugula neritina AB1)]|nr:hypothetical protein ACH42_14385 [Endozoicomonas sp. (ex Bugula neritina AB1)]
MSRPYLIPGIALILVTAFVLATRPKLNTFNGKIMGTTYSVGYVTTLFENPVNEISQKVHAALADVDQRMSTYKKDSELMQFNGALVGQPVTLSQDIVDLVWLAQHYSQLSEGAYDVTVGPLVNLWGFGPSHWAKLNEQGVRSDDEKPINAPEFVQWMIDEYPGAVPSPELIEEARANVGYQYLEVDRKNSTLIKKKALFLDLNSIAKGYGVDQGAAALRAAGITDYMVEVGGEILVKGKKPNGQPWKLAVIGPEMGQNGVSAIVAPGDKALATSGDYLNFFEVNGKRYSHTINPATGWPEAKRIAEVAVIADTVAEADAMATMFMVLGDKEGLALANKEGIAARFAYYTGDGYETVTSEAFRPYLVK